MREKFPISFAADLSLQLSTGKMPPEAQKTAGEITHRISEILLDLSGLGVHYNHQNKIKKNITIKFNSSLPQFRLNAFCLNAGKTNDI